MTLKSAPAGDTLVLTLDRAPVNALNLPTIEMMASTFDIVARNPPKAGVVLTGAGDKAFSAGVDVNVFFEEYGPELQRAMLLAITRMTAALLAIPCPVVAAVNGHALGGGFVLMLCCDHRIAPESSNARFGLLEAKAGVPFPAGPAEIVRHELPPTLLRRWSLASTIVAPRELLATGVVDALHAPKMVLYEALKVAAELAKQPAFAAVKRQVRGPLADRIAALVASGAI
ncbi:MAG TPA: enoyl-CoA hydratase/isomerase family protein [Reyranellaceae bacterium]|nr:enoyl-CoA hydratase/isomerase family protein [Reyranellaceae bacterium]